LNGVIFVFLRVEPWGGRVDVTYASCMTVSDLMWRLLLNAHSFIPNNKLCTLRKTYAWTLNPRFNLSTIKYSRTVGDHYFLCCFF